MSNCSNGANSQLKMMQARLDRIDDDLIAHYAGISELVANLAKNPTTAGAVAPSLRTYNFSALGQTLLSKLKSLIPGYDKFKTLQNLDAAALIGNMGERAALQAANMAVGMAEDLAAAATAQVTALTNQVAATAALAQGIARNVSQADRLALEAALSVADGALAAAEAQLSGVKSASDALNQFIQCLTDVASCRTRSGILDNRL
jgi:hypothetical protein